MTFTQKRFLVLAGLLVFSAWWPLAWSQQRPSSGTTVLTGATLIDGTGKAPVPASVVVIEGDRIKAVGGKETPVPAGATVIDLSGKFLIPGLVDSHVHYQKWLGELMLNHGVTTVVAIQPREIYGDAYYRASQRPDVRSPRLFDYGGVLQLNPSMTRAQVHEMIQQWLKKEPAFAKLPTYNDKLKQVYQWTTQEIHDAGLVTFGHAENCLDAAGAGLDVIEHLWGCAVSLMTPDEAANFQKGKFLHWGLFFKDKARNDQLIKDAMQKGATYINPTLLYEFSSQTSMAPEFEQDSFRVFQDPGLMAYFPRSLADGLLIKFRIARSFNTKYGTMVLSSHLNDQEKRESRDAYRLTGEFVKRWAELGGKVMGGTDVPSIGTSGLSVHLEMEMMVENGLPPMLALQSQLFWGAEMLTARRKTPTTPSVGLIAEGAYADLVVLAANPLDRIANTRKIERVMKGGRFVQLGYTPDYTSAPTNLVRSTPFIQEPEISSITPNRVVEGSPDFELVVDGDGFLPDTVVRVSGVAVPTTFVDIRTLKARIPASMVAEAVPNRFMLSTNPDQSPGVYGDRTLKVTTFTGPPDGGVSNSVSLKIIAKWMASDKKK